jgi:hypothetical protein
LEQCVRRYRGVGEPCRVIHRVDPETVDRAVLNEVDLCDIELSCCANLGLINVNTRVVKVLWGIRHINYLEGAPVAHRVSLWAVLSVVKRWVQSDEA